jgi:nitrate/TMAO reductase-like tetraheme cytochrome c subunit
MPLIFTLQRFWRGLSTNLLGSAGVVLTTTSFFLFIVAEVLRLIGVVTNAYLGLITYLALPALFVFGLTLIPLGWWLYRRRSGKSTKELLADRFDPELVAPKQAGSRVVRLIVLLSLVNVIFLGAGSARMLQFMDTPEFCGTACHSVMGPEWAVYQASPHSRVKCVECHVGTSAEAMLDAKLNGLWQMISVSFDLYERPIPTPVHNLRPARETCEKCHWPQAFYGDRLKRFVHFENDKASTPVYTTLALKVGSGKGDRREEIHWHVAAKNAVRYLAADPKRKQIRWVEARQPDGTWKRYTNRALIEEQRKLPTKKMPTVRNMDCVDCHNRATHIFEDPTEAVDKRVASGAISRSLPFARRQALDALTGSLPVGKELEAMERSFRNFYKYDFPEVAKRQGPDIDKAVTALQAIYKRNIHPGMNVGWNSYADHIGHRRGTGCRRCHNPDMVSEDSQAVGHGCTICHSILAYESPKPLQYLEPDPKDPTEAEMGNYLRGEFLKSIGRIQ